MAISIRRTALGFIRITTTRPAEVPVVRRVLRAYLASVKRTAPVRTGRYKRGLRVRNLDRGASLVNFVPYARYLEHWHEVSSASALARLRRDILAAVRRDRAPAEPSVVDDVPSDFPGVIDGIPADFPLGGP